MKKRSGIIRLILSSMIIMASISNVNGKNGIFLGWNSTIYTDTTILKVDTFNLDIIAPSSGIQYYKDGIVFLSSSKSEGKMLSNHLSFGKIDARYAVLNNSRLESYQIFSSSSAFPYPCEAITFNSDFTIMYFTKYSTTDNSEKIYEAKLSTGSGDQPNWTFDNNPLSFCTDLSIYTHPSLSSDGETMVFASNRSGSLGGMDLFMSSLKGGTWSAPVNIGESINTKSNELYPFLDSEKNLFFSSDGLQGSGGYDIFICRYKDGAWEKPINLSTQVNTKFDDVAFTVSRKDGKSAFYTVKQSSGRQPARLIAVKLNPLPATGNVSNLSQFFTGSVTPDVLTPEKIISVAKEPEVKAKQQVIQEETKKVAKPANTPTGKPANTDANNQVSMKQAPAKTTEPAVKQPVAVITTPAAPEAQKKPAETKVEDIKAKTSEVSDNKDIVVFRVQIFSGGTGGSTKVKIEDKPYMTYEYKNNGLYRTCVGEFSTLAPAKEFQGVCRKSGFPQAFVVAFKNNVRTTDPALFK